MIVFGLLFNSSFSSLICLIIEGRGRRLNIKKDRVINGSFFFNPNDLIFEDGSRLIVDESPTESLVLMAKRVLDKPTASLVINGSKGLILSDTLLPIFTVLNGSKYSTCNC